MWRSLGREGLRRLRDLGMVRQDLGYNEEVSVKRRTHRTGWVLIDEGPSPPCLGVAMPSCSALNVIGL